MCSSLLIQVKTSATLSVTDKGYKRRGRKKKLLYIQLVETLIQDILSGKLEAASKVSNVRDMALNHKVNPKTVQKAFAYREERQIFSTQFIEEAFAPVGQLTMSYHNFFNFIFLQLLLIIFLMLAFGVLEVMRVGRS